jgi:hypothetical protein
MGIRLPANPVEQAKVLRRLADDIERAHEALPVDIFAPILDRVEHLDRHAQLDALDHACGAWKEEDHPELADGAAAHVEAMRSADEVMREGRPR